MSNHLLFFLLLFFHQVEKKKKEKEIEKEKEKERLENDDFLKRKAGGILK